MANMSIATKRTAKILAFAALLGASAYGMLGSAAGLAQATAAPPHVALPISINAVMVALVDQAAHEIWDGGNQDRDLTDREWLLIEQHALQLAAAGSVISLGGTGPADHGWMLSPAWQDWSRKLGAVALEAKAGRRCQEQSGVARCRRQADRYLRELSQDFQAGPPHRRHHAPAPLPECCAALRRGATNRRSPCSSSPIASTKSRIWRVKGERWTWIRPPRTDTGSVLRKSASLQKR